MRIFYSKYTRYGWEGNSKWSGYTVETCREAWIAFPLYTCRFSPVEIQRMNVYSFMLTTEGPGVLLYVELHRFVMFYCKVCLL